MALRVSQDAIEILLDQDPSLRISQDAVELLVDQDPALRISQAAVEALIATAEVRVTQEVVEAAIAQSPDLRITQNVNEVGLGQDANLIVTQAVVEAAISEGVELRVTQVVPEVACEDDTYEDLHQIYVTQTLVEVGVQGPGTGANFGNGTIRISQQPLEWIGADAPLVRISQASVEAVEQVISPVRISQAAPELLAQDDTNILRVSQVVVEIIKTFTCAEVFPPIIVSICPPVDLTGTADGGCPAAVDLTNTGASGGCVSAPQV